MSKYAIYFGKDPEEMEDWCWPDLYTNSEDFKKSYVAGEFHTENVNFFWEVFLTIVDSPVAMWYWVVIDGQNYLSGAIDPGDPAILLESFGEKKVPEFYVQKIKERY